MEKSTVGGNLIFKKGFNKILIPIDFGKPSLRAIDFGINLLDKQKEVSIFVLHVHHTAVYPVADATYQVVSVANSIESSEKEEMVSFMEHIKNLFNANGFFNVVTEIVEGEPVNEILKKIDSFEPDLIVMGNRGQGFAKGIFFGSVSQRVSANSRASVLIVK